MSLLKTEMTPVTFLSLRGCNIHGSCYLLFTGFWSFILMIHNRKGSDTWGTYVFLSHLKLSLGKGLYKKTGSGQFHIDILNRRTNGNITPFILEEMERLNCKKKRWVF